jgi:hypothetical protein
MADRINAPVDAVEAASCDADVNLPPAQAGGQQLSGCDDSVLRARDLRNSGVAFN